MHRCRIILGHCSHLASSSDAVPIATNGEEFREEEELERREPRAATKGGKATKGGDGRQDPPNSISIKATEKVKQVAQEVKKEVEDTLVQALEKYMLEALPESHKHLEKYIKKTVPLLPLLASEQLLSNIWSLFKKGGGPKVNGAVKVAVAFVLTAALYRYRPARSASKNVVVSFLNVLSLFYFPVAHVAHATGNYWRAEKSLNLPVLWIALYGVIGTATKYLSGVIHNKVFEDFGAISVLVYTGVGVQLLSPRKFDMAGLVGQVCLATIYHMACRQSYQNLQLPVFLRVAAAWVKIQSRATCGQMTRLGPVNLMDVFGRAVNPPQTPPGNFELWDVGDSDDDYDDEYDEALLEWFARYGSLQLEDSRQQF